MFDNFVLNFNLSKMKKTTKKQETKEKGGLVNATKSLIVIVILLGLISIVASSISKKYGQQSTDHQKQTKQTEQKGKNPFAGLTKNKEDEKKEEQDNKPPVVKDIDPQIAANIEKLIKENQELLFGPGVKAQIKEIGEESGVYKAILVVNGQEVPFYLTKGDKLVFQMLDIAQITQGQQEGLSIEPIKNGQVNQPDKLKTEIDNLVKNYLLANKEIPVEISGLSVEDGLLKVMLIIDGKEKEIYFTADGRKVILAAQKFDEYIERAKQQMEERKKSSQVGDEYKTDKPVVDVFVMSYCPYGTQIEKGLLPVLRLLQGKIDARIRFVDYAMHGKKELDENITQYCIQKDTPEKFYDYLECFLETEDSKGCVQKLGIDPEKLAKCTDDTDKEFKVSENFQDKSTWKGNFPTFNIDSEDNLKYQVAGSPTLVINGQKIVPLGRDANSLLQAICSAFKNPPKECDEKLSADTPSPGFGNNTQNNSGSAGGCGQ